MRRLRFKCKRKVVGRGKGKGRGIERDIGNEVLAEREKIANAPAGNGAQDPSNCGRCSTIEPPRQATSPSSSLEILSALPPLHNIGIIQCPQLTQWWSISRVCWVRFLAGAFAISPILPKLNFQFPFSFPSPFDLSFALIKILFDIE